MPEEVRCSRCGQSGPPIAGRIPFRSELRELVAARICQRCWKEWLDEQIRVINELALNLGDPRSHEIIEDHARRFLGLQEPAAEPGTAPA